MILKLNLKKSITSNSLSKDKPGNLDKKVVKSNSTSNNFQPFKLIMPNI